MMYKFVIDGTLPSMNQIVAEAKIHHSKYADTKRQYTEMVAWSAKTAKLPKMERVRLFIDWHYPDKLLDPDNIRAGIKFILDGLVMAGILPNDGWKQIAGFKDEFHVDRENPRVEVSLVEVAPEKK